MAKIRCIWSLACVLTVAGMAAAQAPPALLPPLPETGPVLTPPESAPRLVVPIGASPPNPVAPAPAQIAPVSATLTPAAAERRMEESALFPPGKQEAHVSLEWIGPTAPRAGHPADYVILVRNLGPAAAQHVQVRARMPGEMTLEAAEPKPVPDGEGMRWDLGTLPAKQERRVQLRLLALRTGEADCQAWVTFHSGSAHRMRICEPRLRLQATAPDRLLIGDNTTLVFSIDNAGDAVAEQVRLRVALPPGFDHPRGKQFELDVGSIRPGEQRQVPVAAIASQGGDQACEAMVLFEGAIQSRSTCSSRVLVPRLALTSTGPQFRYLERKALYSIHVANNGDGPAANVIVSDALPRGLRFLQASDGGRYDPAVTAVSWVIGELAPGESREFKVEAIPCEAGEQAQRISAQAARGGRVEGSWNTTVEALSALLLEVVDVEDPVEVGAENTYEIRITNIGTRAESDLKLVCAIPEGMEVRGVQGTTGAQMQGNDLVFDPLPPLPPRVAVKYRVVVRYGAAGAIRFTARLTAQGLAEPVVESQTTKVYVDRVEK